MKGAVFLDVGAYMGETLSEVLKRHYAFQTVYAFEPMPTKVNELFVNYADPRLHIFNYGLGDHTGPVKMYGHADGGTSIYPEKDDVDKTIVTDVIMVEASHFFRNHIDASDTNILKLNVEGSEIPILNNLIDTGEIWKLANVMIDFDIMKVPGREHLRDIMLDRFLSIGFRKYSLREDVMTRHGAGFTHANRIEDWLGGLRV